MDKKLLERLIGVVVILALLIIFVPMLFSPRFHRKAAPQHIPTPPPKPNIDLSPNEKIVVKNVVAASTIKTEQTVALPTPQTPALTSDQKKRLETAKAYDSGFVVQLGVFSQRENAMNLASKLRDAGFSAFVYPPKGSSKDTTKRVFAGPCATKKDADDLKVQIQAKTGRTGFVAAFKPLDIGHE